MSRLRLVSIITHTNPGGAQGAILSLSRELRRRGHDIEVWFLYGKTTHFRDEPGVRILLQHTSPNFLGYLRILFRLVKRLISVRLDGVITFLPLACVMGQTGARLAGIRCRVASQRNPYWTYGLVMRFCDKIAGSLGMYTCNVANSRSVYESFLSYPRSYLRRMTVVYNGVAWQPSALTRAEARAKFDLPAASPLVVTIGRLSEQKNQALLLETLPELPRVHLAVVGEGELRENLQARARDLGVEDRSHFLGQLNRADIPDFLCAADVFALPSRFEGHCNALLEAMSAGLPVLASDIPSHSESLREEGHEPTGRLLPLNDLDSWIRAINEMILDSDLRASLGVLAQARAAAFSVERMGDGFEQAMCNSLGVSNGGCGRG